MTTKERLDRAWDIVGKLQAWIVDREDLSAHPNAAMTVCVDSLEISIGHITVWNDHEFGPEEMTFENCRNEFLEEIAMFVPFLQEELTGADEEMLPGDDFGRVKGENDPHTTTS